VGKETSPTEHKNG